MLRRRVFSLLALTLLVEGSATAQAPADADVGAALKAYYDDPKKEPAWRAAVEALAGADATARAAAVRSLVALVERAAEDERAGAAPWRATPFWGSSGVNPARELRAHVVDALATTSPRAEALPLVRWYLEHEPIERLQSTAMKALARWKGAEPDALRLELATRPHDNAVVVVSALEQLGGTTARLPAETLAALCQHHRQSVRFAARKLRRAQGGGAAAPFDPTAAMARPAVQALLDRVGELVVETAPPASSYIEVELRCVDARAAAGVPVRGWALDSGELLSPWGWRKRLGTGCKPRLVAVADEVARVEALRKKGDEGRALSRRGHLTGQFEGNGASLYELLLARWLHEAKRDDLAARVLLPALDTLFSDGDVVELVKHRLAQEYGYQMIAAFVGDRDYPRALRLARLLGERYPGTAFHDAAVRLQRELPQRGDDFSRLRLPPADEWATMRARLTRAQAIEYLAQRMRLLNCFQMGQPGGFAYSDTQFTEASGISDDAAWGLGGGHTRVINPYVELVGQRDGYFPQGKARSTGLDLTVADIPLLVPWLRDDWLLLIVSFWRDFHPARELHGSRALFASIINDVARQQLVDPRKLDGMSGPERERELQRIVDWARANGARGEADLLLAALEDALRRQVYFHEVEEQAERLVALREKRAVPLLLRWLSNPQNSEFHVRSILRCARRIDAAALRPIAEKYAQHEAAGVRLQVGMAWLRAGDAAQARDALGRVLEKGDSYSLHDEDMVEAVGALLDDGSDESRGAAARFFAVGKDLQKIEQPGTRAWLFRRFAAAGIADGLRFYRRVIDQPGHQLGGTTYGQPVAVHFADEVAHYLAADDAALQRATGDLATVKRWLDDKIANPRSLTPPPRR